MKVIVVSTDDNAAEVFANARRLGYLTFIYNHADPFRELSSHKFSYVGSDQELVDKIRLLEMDHLTRAEVLKW